MKVDRSPLATLQKQFSGYWFRQTKAQRITMIALLSATLIIIPVILVWAATPTYQVAYSGLSESDAGQIVQKMDELNIPYQVQDKGTILVPSDQVYTTRLNIAREGLPQDSTVGFELFDSNTFGMTEFTQRVNYQRALEGELERTISSLDAVESVQVHIVTPEKSLLSSAQSPTTASITISERNGKALDEAQVQAMVHLVSSSVQDLKPENVVVIDSAGNLLSGGPAISSEDSAAERENQRAAEALAAAEVKKRVQTMLDGILGPDKAVVQASVTMDWNQHEVTSNTYNPTPAAVRSSQMIKESYTTDGADLGGIPGAASNLPTPVATVVAGGGLVNYAREENTINYEITQIESREVITPGQVSRLSVSVMVDGINDAQQLASIRAVAAAAAGINESRGDQIVVDSLPFDRSAAIAQSEAAQQDENLENYGRIATFVLIGVLLLALVLFFQRMLHNLRLSSQTAWQPVLMPAGQLALAANSAQSGGKQVGANQNLSALPPGKKSPESQPADAADQLFPPSPASGRGAGDEGQIFPLPTGRGAGGEGVELELSRPKHPRQQETEQRVQLLTRLAEENPATVAEIIQFWLNEDGGSGGENG